MVSSPSGRGAELPPTELRTVFLWQFASAFARQRGSNVYKSASPSGHSADPAATASSTTFSEQPAGDNARQPIGNIHYSDASQSISRRHRSDEQSQPSSVLMASSPSGSNGDPPLTESRITTSSGHDASDHTRQPSSMLMASSPSGRSAHPSPIGSRITFSGQIASDNSRQHNGNVYNNTTYQYTPRMHRSDATLPSDEQCEGLLKAASEGQTARVYRLLQLGVSPDHSDIHGFTALHHAALSGFEDTVDLLIGEGCDVNVASFNLGTPLHLAAYKARENVIQRLLVRRADVNAKSRLMGSPLHCAATSGSLAIVSLLIKEGASARNRSIVMEYPLSLLDPSFEGEMALYESEPLLHAAVAGDVSVVNFLVDQGVAIDAGARVWYAKQGQDLCFERCPERLADYTALMGAAAQGCPEVCRFLLENGAEVNAQDSCGASALHWSTTAAQLAALKVILEAKATVGLGNQNGDAPLHIAAHYGYIEVVQALVSSDADAKATVGLRNKNGDAPLHIAAHYGYTEIV